MEATHYSTEILWLCTWPMLIYVSYKFIALNIFHFEENLKDK